MVWDETLNDGRGGYQHGPIDWDAFWQVVKGYGPMNKDRIKAYTKTVNDGQWVRDAALAYAEKAAAREASVAAE